MVVAMVLTLVPAISIAAPPITPAATDIVIMHVNDAHGRDFGSSTTFSTAGVASLKQKFLADTDNVYLISAGDAIQGTPLVNQDQGASAVKFMSAAGYDLLVPGNHEFDFGKDNLLSILDDYATFPVLSANIFEDDTKASTLFDSYMIEDFNGTKVAFIGLTTPETYTKTHPDKIAGLFFEMDDDLYELVQDQINEVKTAGADYVVVVGHLGTDVASIPNRSTDIIANTNGIDIFIDGHSHTRIDGGNKVAWEDGMGEALLVSAGQYLERIGVLVIDSGGNISHSLLSPADYTAVDPAVKAIVDTRNAEVEVALAGVIGTTEVTLYGKNTTNPPGVRMSQTNLGDFATDALLWVAREDLGGVLPIQIDGAITNGGGIRDSIPTDGRVVSASSPYAITMKDMVTVFPFGNTVTVIGITGAQLLEALEAATCSTPAVLGAFPHIAGIEFVLHAYVPYVNGPLYPGTTYYSPANPGARVQDVKIGGVPLDLDKTYYIATNDFTAAGGDTYAIFKKCSAFINIGVALEDALIRYLDEELGGVVSAQYAAPQGRSRVITNVPPFEITFDPCNDTATATSLTDNNAKLTSLPPEPAKAGYTFNGWFTAVTGGTKITTSYAFSGDTTVYAQWTENPPSTGGGGVVISYTITFNSNGGSAVANQTVVRNAKVIKPADPTKTEYTFNGWYTDEALKNAYDFDKAVTSSFTLYAGWIKGIMPTVPVNPFSDVVGEDWFIDDVIFANSIGLIDGRTPTEFCPNENMTYAEAVTLAARMHQYYTTGKITLKNGDPWYKSYVDYAKENGIIDKDYEWKAPVTRAGYIEIFANALPDEAFAVINDIDDDFVPDVPADHPQAAAIYKLYRAGILQGNNAEYECMPDTNIKRSEVAAIVTRMLKADARIEFDI